LLGDKLQVSRVRDGDIPSLTPNIIITIFCVSIQKRKAWTSTSNPRFLIHRFECT
jgi:hypothetical protein